MKQFLLLLLCLYTMVAYSQINLSGSVFDKNTSEGLAGAAVYIPELKRGTIANGDGKFSFEKLPAGSYLLNIKYVGYASQNVTVKLTHDTTLSIFLSATAAELNDVVVTGVSKATEVRESPVAITLVNQTDLLGNTSLNLVEGISKLPGVSAISTGAAISKPVIRGLGYNRVVVLNDGFRQEGQQWGDEHGVEIDEASIGRVEIVRGPGSLMYGSDAIGGVVNFLPSEPIAEGRIAAQAYFNYQSNNQLLSSSLMTAGNINGFTWNLRGSQKTAGNYTNRYDGRVWNSGYREWNMNGGFSVSKRWGYSNVSFSTFNQQLGFNEGERDSAGYFLQEVISGDTTIILSAIGDDLKGYRISVPSQRVSHHRVSIQNKIFVGTGNIVLNAGWQLNERREFVDVANPSDVALGFQLHTATLLLQYHLPELKEWNTAFGVSSMFQKNTNTGSEFLIPDYYLFDYGIFGTTQKRFGKWLFEAGLRFDQRLFRSQQLFLNEEDEPTNPSDSLAIEKFTSLNRTFYNFSGSVGFSYRVNDAWTVKFNFAKGFRSPTAAELLSNGNHEGTYRYEYGNVQLKPESGYQADAGISFTDEHVNVNVNVFENTVVNYIGVQKLSSVFGGDSLMEGETGGMVPAFRFTQRNALLAGVELSMDIHPHPADWLHFENSFGYVYAIAFNQPDSLKHLAFTPPAHFRSELRFDIPKTGKILRGLFAGVHFDYFFHQKNVLRADNTETPTPDYALVGANAGFDIHLPGGGKLLTLIIAAENITNTTYQSHLSRLKYLDTNPVSGRQGIWNPGRNFSVKFLFPLEFEVGKKR